MSTFYIVLFVLLGILALPAIFVIGVLIYIGIKDVVMHYVYKYDLFNARKKWLNDHPNWDKPRYGGNNMLSGFIDYISKPERPW